VEVPVGDY
jgi:hypothetical protein